MASCLFCDIAAGRESAVWVARSPEAVAFAPLPESRLAPGHTLVIPVRHSSDLFAADPRSVAATTGLVQRVARGMRESLGASGVNVLHASGESAGQSASHLHFHVVPRWDDDNATFWPDHRAAHHTEDDPYCSLAEAISATVAALPTRS